MSRQIVAEVAAALLLWQKDKLPLEMKKKKKNRRKAKAWAGRV